MEIKTAIGTCRSMRTRRRRQYSGSSAAGQVAPVASLALPLIWPGFRSPIQEDVLDLAPHACRWSRFSLTRNGHEICGVA